ncbi:MAG: hypothetical protein QOH87_1241 [Trebonia sp.]|jgi:cytochrome P450|nr:hypothetical protein [Trebonia sp.]
MTALLTIEFEDEHGTTRRLAREEVLTYVTLVGAHFCLGAALARLCIGVSPRRR